MKKRLLLVGSAFILTIVRGLWLATRPWESLSVRAVRLCVSCGMLEPEVFSLIQHIRASGQTPEQAIDAWEQTYDDPDALWPKRGKCA